MKKLKAIGWIILFAILWGILILLGVYAVVSAEPIHYTDWLTFTDDADRERQIDSVGAVVDTLTEPSVYVVFRVREDSSPVMVTNYYPRQIAFVEIKVWPHYISIQSPMILGRFRVAWKENK